MHDPTRGPSADDATAQEESSAIPATPAWAEALLAALLGVAVWAVTLPTSFLYDSQALATIGWLEWKSEGLAQSLVWSPHGGGFRPSTRLSLYLTGECFGGNVVAHRLVNLLSHALTVFFVWFVGRRLGIARALLLPTALLFAWSPSFGFLVPWIAGRPELHAGAAIAGLFLAVSATHRGVRRGRVATWSLLLLAAIACLTKEVVILVPAALPFLVGPPPKRRWVVAWGAAFTVLLGIWRVTHHNMHYTGDVARDYNPATMLTDFGRLVDILLGAGDLFTAFFLQYGPWEWAGPTWLRIAVFVILAVSSVLVFRHLYRRGGLERAAALLVVLVLLPNLPFLNKGYGYYLYVPAVLVWPLSVMLLQRAVPLRWLRPALWLFVALALWGAARQTIAWQRASDTYRSVIRAVEPERDAIRQQLIEAAGRGESLRPHWIVVEGLPTHEGPIELFAQQELLYLSYGFYLWFDRADNTDPKFLENSMIRFYGGTMGDEERRRLGLEASGTVVRVFEYEEGGIRAKDEAAEDGG